MTQSQLTQLLEQFNPEISKMKKSKEFTLALQQFVTTTKPKYNRPANIEFKGEEYRWCRYTNKYFLNLDMVFTSDKTKDKGYSKVGIALWSKAAKFKKDNHLKLEEEYFELAMSGKTDEARTKKEYADGYLTLEQWNSPEFLVDKFLSLLSSEQQLRYNGGGFSAEQLV